MRLGLVAVLLCALLTGGAVAGSAPGVPSADGATVTGETDAVPPGATVVANRCPGGPTDSSRTTLAELERGEDPAFVEVHPNPTTHGNVGEFFVLVFPEETRLANWTVTDGHTTASLPNETVSGRVAFSMDPDETRSMTADRVLELEGYLRLAADGDELELHDDDRVVDSISYGRASTGERWYRTGDGGVWWPKGATCLPSTTVEGEEVTVFVLPDSPEVPLQTLAEAEDRILLAGYTYTSEAVTEELRAAAERGVEVAVVLESGPVGGMPEETSAVLDELDEAGATVRVLGGGDSRYRFHHPKYAVVDDRAMVLTENWKPSGVGGTASRGWGVVVDDPEVSNVLADVFEADFEGWDTVSWERHREEATFIADDDGRRDGSFETTFDPEPVSVDAVEVLLAPDNAEERTLELLGSAEESIRIKQVRIGDADFPLLEESLEAARRGVEVTILLDATWYVEDENRELANHLERTAEEEGLPLEVRLVEPDGRFEKIHAKGVVIDEAVVIVGSPNWNDVAFRENREVALVLHGEEAGSYYAAVFDADWEERSWPLPVDLVGVVALGLVAAGLVGRRYVRLEAPAEEIRPEELSAGSRTGVNGGSGPRVGDSRPADARAAESRDDAGEGVDRSGVSRADSTSNDGAPPADGEPCTDKIDTGTGERLRDR
ncbi:phospholipase D-like domain-containing protein [Natronobeatus ordinarius]|uniref:phospholipase D-like domain-containing protein n=1 Tax=Natronobeatus ordinarius TaxID=2963433 RepID=UPI0020CC71FB|nr:phospholipase D-like domain-containing protein [Natronobeatus ordinarius]